MVRADTPPPAPVAGAQHPIAAPPAKSGAQVPPLSAASNADNKKKNKGKEEWNSETYNRTLVEVRTADLWRKQDDNIILLR